MSMAQLPVISFAAYAGGNKAARLALAEEIDAAARDAGFFYLTNHGIDPTIIEATFAAAETFFDLPEADKAAIAIANSSCHRGWFRDGEEALDEVNHPQGDYKEGIKIGQDLPPDHPRVRDGLPLHGANQWPKLAGWQETMTQCYRACENLGHQLMACFALALGQPEDYFEPWLTLPMATLAPLRYPPLRADKARVSAGAHTDFGCLTLLMQSGMGGLEIRLKNGDWLAVPPRDGHLVVNIGDMLARWSNDRYASTLHRVMNRADAPRHSMAFFFDPDPQADLAALPGCLAKGETPHYPAATALSHLLEKIDKSFAYRQEKA